MNRTQLTLAVLLVLQVALILLVRSPFSSASTRTEPRPLLPNLEAITPARMEIDGKDGESITLVRKGDDWVIEELDEFPADDHKVEQLLGDLERIEVRRPVVTKSRYHEAFKVADDDNEGQLRVWDAEDKDPRANVIFGTSPNYRTTHVRLGGENEIYEIQGIAPYDVRPAPSAWIRKELIDASEGEVERLTLSNEKGRLELEKREGSWKVVAPADRKDESLDQEKVGALLRAATGLRLTDAAGPVDAQAQGFASPAATLVLGLAGGDSEAGASTTELTLEVGDKVADEENQRYVTRSGFGYAGTIWESSIRPLIEDSLDDLRAAEPKES